MLKRRSTAQIVEKDEGGVKRKKSTIVHRESSTPLAQLRKQTTKDHIRPESSLEKRKSKEKSLSKKLSLSAAVLQKQSSTESLESESPVIKKKTKGPGLTRKLSSLPSLQKQSSTESLESESPVIKKKTKEPGLTRKLSSLSSISASTKEDSGSRGTFNVINVPTAPEPKAKQLLYYNGQHLAVRSDDGSFYLCRTLQNVWSSSKEIWVKWYTANPDGETYHTDYDEKIGTDVILRDVRLSRKGGQIRVKPSDVKDICNLIKKSELAEKGVAVEISDDEEEPPAKKRKREKKTKEKAPKKPKIKKITSTSGVKKAGLKKVAAPRKKKEKVDKPKKKEKVVKPKKEKKKTKAEREAEDLLLHPIPSIKLLEKDPLFESKDSVPFVSKYAHSKLAIRAILQNDIKLLKKLLKDSEHVYHITHQRSVDVPLDAMHYAIKENNTQAVQLLCKELKGKSDRKKEGHPDSLLMSRLGTGSYNYRSLGIHRIRAVMLSRGSREGNNALTKDETNISNPTSSVDDCYKKFLLEKGGDEKVFAMLNGVKNLDEISYYEFKSMISDVHTCVRNGHRKLAGALVQKILDKCPHYGKFNTLFPRMLLYDKEEYKGSPPSQVNWTAKACSFLTPIHCAAINPNVAYLEKLLKICPEFHIMDKTQRRPIHYAAACEGPAPLEFILNSGGGVFDADRNGNIPLHIACETGRLKNVELLLKHCKDKAASAAVADPLSQKFGVGCVNRPNRWSWCPLHLACETGNLEIVKTLVKFGAEVNAQLNIAKNRLRPLMIAAQKGHLNVVKYLAENGAIVEDKDRMGRSALIHAAMNGNVHIMSFLMKMGSNPSRKDTSGNSVLHYCAAYGWIFGVNLLLDNGVDPNVANDWKVTPVSVAYLKGHFGIVDVLLKHPSVDVNFQDEQGETLVSIAASSDIVAGLYDQMVYLIEKKKADCTLSDTAGSTPLHFLAGNSVAETKEFHLDVLNNEMMDVTVKIAKLMVDHGCDPHTVNDRKETALINAALQGNSKLVEYLMKQGCSLSDDLAEKGISLLHEMATENLDWVDYAAMVKKLMECGGAPVKDLMMKWIKTPDKTGFTPLLYLCQTYKNHSKRIHITMDDEHKKIVCQQWELGRKFMKFLITDLKASVDDVVQERQFEAWEEKPEEAEKRYTSPTTGKCSAVHFLLSAKSEIGKCNPVNWETTETNVALRMVLKYKPDLNIRNLVGHTPLTEAITNNNTEVVKLLVTGTKVDVNMPSIVKESGRSIFGAPAQEKTVVKTPPICHAARNDIEIVKALLDHGANVNKVDSKEKKTALHTAIENDKKDIAKVLIEQGSDVNATDKNLKTPLHLVVYKNEGGFDANTEMEELLISNGAKLELQDEDGNTALHYVFHNPSGRRRSYWSAPVDYDPVEQCRLIVSALKKDTYLNIANKKGETPLHVAADCGSNMCCMYLIKKGSDVKKKNKDGNTPLAIAMNNKNDRCATALVQNGSSLKDKIMPVKTEDEKDKSLKELPPAWNWALDREKHKKTDAEGMPYFEKAIQENLTGVTFMILEWPEETTGLTLQKGIEMAINVKQYNVALRLLARVKDKNQVKEKRMHGRTLLHHLSLSSDAFLCDGGSSDLMKKVAELIVDRGVSASVADDYKCLPLHYAILNHNFILANFLIASAGVNTKKADQFNRTLFCAVFWKFEKMDHYNVREWIDYLLKSGAALNATYDFPIGPPTFGQSSKVTVDDYWTTKSSLLVTPLIYAIYKNDFKLVTYLLNVKKANVNTADSNQKYPIMYAIEGNNEDIVRVLLNHNYDPHAVEEKKKEKKLKVKKKVFKLHRTTSKASADLNADDESSDDDEDESEDEEEKEKEKKIKEVVTVKLTSGLNLKATDKRGYSIVHYIVEPLENGLTFDNTDILHILSHVGIKIDTVNKDGLTPLELALKNGAVNLAKMIQKLKNVQPKNMKTPEFISIPVKDNLFAHRQKVNFKNDAVKMFEKLKVPVAMEVDEEDIVTIDRNCNIKKGNVAIDPDLKIPCDALLTKVDVSQGVWGLYNFYQLQLVFQPGKNIYVLFTRWGRIGDSGQYQHTPFQTLPEGIKEFAKIFRAKSGNKWQDVKSFEPVTKKYRLVSRQERRKCRKRQTVEFDLDSSVSSKLTPSIKKVMKEMMSVKTICAAMDDDAAIDSFTMPFGSINKETLIEAQKLLMKIGEHVQTVKEHRKNNKSSLPLEVYQKACEEISKLSSEYFQLIPQKGFEFEKIRPLDKDNEYRAQCRTVMNLLDYEVANKILLGAMFRRKEINPLDYIYGALGCKMQPLDEDDMESQYLLKYLSAGRGSAEVEGILKIEREGENDRMRKKNLGNKKLLFHGSNLANFLSILSRGLVITPPEVPHTGYAFGKGIYFSDSFQKSFAYCQNRNPKSGTLFILVCEVALGKIKERYEADWEDHDRDYDSIQGVGQRAPDPKYDVQLPTGAVLPLGFEKYEYMRGGKSCCLGYNEFIVYDEAQVCLRYLIRLRKKNFRPTEDSDSEEDEEDDYSGSDSS